MAIDDIIGFIAVGLLFILVGGCLVIWIWGAVQESRDLARERANPAPPHEVIDRFLEWEEGDDITVIDFWDSARSPIGRHCYDAVYAKPYDSGIWVRRGDTPVQVSSHDFNRHLRNRSLQERDRLRVVAGLEAQMAEDRYADLLAAVREAYVTHVAELEESDLDDGYTPVPRRVRS